MRLDFNVLWIDDQPQNIASFGERLNFRTQEEGFKLNVTQAKSLDEATKHLADDVFLDGIDLVVVDYNLGASEWGDVAVRKIRNKVPYKDIVFYSAKETADLRQIMLTEGVEGVFCAHRADLPDTLIGVFESLIKKVLDIDHCRGIVMGVTSDIDQIVLDCLLDLAPKLDPKHNESAALYALEKLDERLKRFQSTRDQLFETKTVEALLEAHEAFPAFDRLGLLKTILGLHYNNGYPLLRKAVGKYTNDIPPRRNELGHVRLVAEGGIRTLRGHGTKTVTSEELKDLRQLLIIYRDRFDELAIIVGLDAADAPDEPLGLKEEPT